MSKTVVNGYELQPEVVLCGNKPCRVFIPYVIAGPGGERLYWVLLLHTEEVEIVKESELKLIKNGKLLYGKS